jgi:CheY-like chemotaxis protein
MSDDTYIPTVLYVEDDDATAWLFKAITREKEWKIIMVTATNGSTAMSVLAKSKPFEDVHTPDMILLDIDLPGMDGFHIFREIQKWRQFAEIPVVFFSSSERRADRDFAMKMGAAGFIHKPVDLASFSNAVDQICAFVLANI